MHLYPKLSSSGSGESLEVNAYSRLQNTHSKPTGSPAQPALLQDKLRRPTRTGLMWGAVHKLRVRIGDWLLSTCRTGRGGSPASLRRRDGEWRLSSGKAPRRSQGGDGGGGGARLPFAERPALLSGPRRPAAAARTRSAARSSGRPPGLCRPLARPPAGLRTGAAPRATPRQALTSNTPPPPRPRPLCATAYQSLASAHVTLQSERARTGAGPGRPTPAVAR